VRGDGGAGSVFNDTVENGRGSYAKARERGTTRTCRTERTAGTVPTKSKMLNRKHRRRSRLQTCNYHLHARHGTLKRYYYTTKRRIRITASTVPDQSRNSLHACSNPLLLPLSLQSRNQGRRLQLQTKGTFGLEL
jgi:hypothetical protein